jgi:hypothetical protein
MIINSKNSIESNLKRDSLDYSNGEGFSMVINSKHDSLDYSNGIIVKEKD